MKRLKNRAIKLLMLFVIVFTSMGFLNNSYAATANISASSTNVYVGDSVTITVNINAAAWQLNVSGSGVSDTIVGYDADANNVSTSKKYQLNTSKAGTYTVSLSGNVSDGVTDETRNVGGSVTVTVKEKPTPPPVDNGNNNNNNNNGNNGNNNTNTDTKSSNNYLKSLQVNAEGLSPRFVKTTQNYAITVPEGVTSLNVTAKPENAKAKVYISGNTDLKMGNNTISITVEAENGAKRYYKITVTKVADPSKANALLDNLVIQGIELDPMFQAETLEYNLGKVASDLKSFNILAFPQDENAKVEIIGNDELKAGKNQIVIKVTAPDGATVKEYILNYEKEETSVVPEEEDSLKDVEKKDNFITKTWKTIKANSLILLMYLFILVEFAQIVYLYIKLNEKQKISIKNSKQKNPRNRRLDLNETKEVLEEPEVIEGLKENPRVEFKRRSALKSDDEEK